MLRTRVLRALTHVPRIIAIQTPRVISVQKPGVFNPHTRHFATRSLIDEKIEEFQDLYGTAKDEFEIAAEETEKQTVYAEDDRKAAREEFDKLKAFYDDIVGGQDKEMGEEIQRRIGQRIRELDAAVRNMEELAQNQD